MSLKHAVLALVVERRGYGYELVQRFEERVGPGWQLNPSAVYPALDQLERGGLVTSAARRGGTRRSPRIVYAPTDVGTAALEAWLGATNAPPEPVRADVHLRIAFARHEHRGALAAQLSAHERACGELLARYPRLRRGSPCRRRSARRRRRRHATASGDRLACARACHARRRRGLTLSGRGPAPGTPARSAIRAASTAMVGQAIPCRAPARSTAPAIASSSGSRPAATSRCIERAEAVVEHLELAEHDGRVDVGSLGARRRRRPRRTHASARPSVPGRSGSRRTARRRQPSCTRAC